MLHNVFVESMAEELDRVFAVREVFGSIPALRLHIFAVVGNFLTTIFSRGLSKKTVFPYSYIHTEHNYLIHCILYDNYINPLYDMIKINKLDIRWKPNSE